MSVVSRHGDTGWHFSLRHEPLCKSEGFFILLLSEWFIFPAAGFSVKSREKPLEETQHDIPFLLSRQKLCVHRQGFNLSNPTEFVH